MKGALHGLLASALILSVVAPAARAEKPRKVVVEQFSGPGAERFKRLVQGALGKQGIDVVSDKKRAETETALGLLQVSDNYSAVAKELGVGAFVDGTVTGSKHLTARLKVKGPDGGSLGGASWTGANEKKLLANIGDTVGKKLSGIFESGGGAREAEPVASAPPPPPPAPEKVAEESPRSRKRRASVEDDTSRASKPSEADTTVSAKAEEPEAPSSPFTRLDVAFGIHGYRRSFSYNAVLVGDQRGYTNDGVPAPNLAVDFFFLPFLGLTVGGEYAVAPSSTDSLGATYKVSSFGYFAGLKGRFNLGSSTELTPTVAYAGNSFKVMPSDDAKMPAIVAAVDYKQLRIGFGARIALSEKLALIGGGHYLHLLGMGELKDSFFPGATGRGGEGYAGIALGLPWTAGLEGRLTVDFRRYVFAMNSEDWDRDPTMGSGYIAGGAVDQYLGLSIAFALRR